MAGGRDHCNRRLERNRLRARLTAKRFDLGKNLSSFGFERIPLRAVVGFRVLAGAVLEVQIAEVLIDHLFALAQIVETRLLGRSDDLSLWPEDVCAKRDEEKNGRKKNGWTHLVRTKAQAAKQPGVVFVKGIVYLRAPPGWADT